MRVDALGSSLRLAPASWPRQGASAVPAGVQRRRRRGRPDLLVTGAFHIDRRHHMELAWERQLQHERLLSGTTAEALAASADVVAVLDTRHLERVLEVCSGAVVVLALHSASCGLCKEVLRDLGDVLRECRCQQARVVFLKHDIMDEFDGYSDVAREYGVRSVPRIFFIVDGAVIRRMEIADIRQRAGTRTQVRSVLAVEARRVRATLFELLMLHTPSSRR